MSVIIRYILRELGVTFLLGFVALTLLLLIVGVVKEAFDQYVPLILIPYLIPPVFANMSPISLPVTLLLAVTVFFARMSGNNEVIALKALGIPPRAFLMPVFGIAFFFSILGVGINELAITYGRQGINMVLYYGAEDILIERLKKTHQVVTKNNRITIIVQGVDEQRRLIEPKIISKKESLTIEASIAQIAIDHNTETLTITFFDFRAATKEGRYVGRKRILEIPLSEFFQVRHANHPSDMGLYRINKEQKITAEQMEEQRRIIAAHRTFGACVGSIDAWASSPVEEAKKKIRRLQSHQNKLSVEPPRRWAQGFCCFFFVWLGAPLAIWMRKSDFFASFFACFVPILLLYYPLLAFGLAQAKNGSLPPMCVWTANAVIGLIGLWFLRRIHRY